MADVASLYPQPSAPTNPLTTLSNAAGLVGQLNQNKLFQQQNQARQAIGQSYQQSIDPQTGQLDTNKLLSIVANNPAAAFMAGDVAQQAQARQQSQLAIQKDQLDLAIGHNKAMNDMLGSMLADPSTDTKTVLSNMTTAVKDGRMTAQQAAQEAASMPTDPAALKVWLQGHLLQNADAGQKLQAVYGQTQMLNTGQGQTPIAVSPLTGTHAVGPTFQNQLTPEQLASPKSWYDPATRTQVTGTTAQFLQSTGGGGLPAGVMGAASAAASPQAPMAGAVGPGRMAAPTAGPLPAGPALGASTAADVTAHASAEQGVQLQQTADQAPTRKAALDNMLSDLQNFTSGPGADWQKFANAAANRVLPFGLQINPQGVASQEGFAKLGKQIALAQAGSLGVATDEKLNTTLGANPNDDLSKLGNQQIIGMLKGNEDAITAKNQAWQQYQQSHGPETYGQFSTDFNKSFDPRVFQMNYMSAPQRADMIKAMSPKETKDFNAKINTAVRNGWVDPAAWSASSGR